MNETAIGLIALVILLGLFLTGIELAFAMAAIGFIGFTILNDFNTAVSLMANDLLDALANYGLTAIPLFVLMGQIAFNAGIAKRLYETTHKFLGHIPGGLAVATVAGATVFKAICGSVVATSATFASVAIPEMDRYGYSKNSLRASSQRSGPWASSCLPALPSLFLALSPSSLLAASLWPVFFPALLCHFALLLSFSDGAE
jgi:C4-dicarboxylate transporter DctM subunit